MHHSDFVEKYRNNQIQVHIDKNKAGFFYGIKGFMPDKLRRQQVILMLIAFAGLIGGIVLFFFTKWYMALPVLIVGWYFFPFGQKMAAKGVLEASLQYSYIYEYALSNHTLRISNL